MNDSKYVVSGLESVVGVSEWLRHFGLAIWPKGLRIADHDACRVVNIHGPL